MIPVPILVLGGAALFFLLKKQQPVPPAPPRPVPVPGPGPGPGPGPQPPPVPSAGFQEITDPSTGGPWGPGPSNAPANTIVGPVAGPFPTVSISAMINPTDTNNLPYTGTVTTQQTGIAGSLNVHKGPDLGSPIIGSLNHGDPVTVTGFVALPGATADQPTDIYQVVSNAPGSKTAGFVSGAFITLN